MWKVVLGLYYLKHVIYTRDQENHDESRKLECVNLFVCLLIVYVVMFEHGGESQWSMGFRI